MNKSGTLTVIPLAGLANRLRVMATSIKLASENDKELSIYWHANKDLNAKFHELFDLPLNILISSLPLRYVLLLKIRASSRFSIFSEWYLKLFKFDFIFLDTKSNALSKHTINLQKEVKQAGSPFMCTCEELNYFNLEDYKLFIPRKELLNDIERIAAQFTRDTIGIHIRATDNVKAKQHSPFLVFIKKIEDEILNNQNVRFFLSTDDANYENELLKKFGSERIIVNRKILDRNSLQGMKDAVIDLFCLSKTVKIYGSYFSSFSEVAGRIGNIEVEILQK